MLKLNKRDLRTCNNKKMPYLSHDRFDRQLYPMDKNRLSLKELWVARVIHFQLRCHAQLRTTAAKKDAFSYFFRFKNCKLIYIS